MRNNKGFTLVEIAIVLVIIGLIIGGVMKGQTLINSARSKNVYNQVHNVASAIYTYQDTHGQRLPGDDIQATNNPGNGNGVINGNWNAANGESFNFWQHLRDAGLYQAGTGRPLNAYGQAMGVQTNIYATGANVVSLCMTMPGSVAQTLDSAYDDGFRDGGDILAVNRVAAGTAASVPYIAARNYTVCFVLN